MQRITFVEVTKPAVLAALAAPRELAGPLVDAYLARRAVDYLLGFHLTPVLWRKLPAAKSAGAQTSARTLVCVMLLSSGSCNREMRAGKRWARAAPLGLHPSPCLGCCTSFLPLRLHGLVHRMWNISPWPHLSAARPPKAASVCCLECFALFHVPRGQVVAAPLLSGQLHVQCRCLMCTCAGLSSSPTMPT